MKKNLQLLYIAGCLGYSTCIYAGAFQLWEQDGASVGNYHAGRVAIAEDASTAYYNPAGLIRIQHKQLVLAGDPIVTNIKFHGTVQISTLNRNPYPVSAQGGGYNFIPSGHYAMRVSPNVVLGLSIVVPYGLKTDYHDTTFARYSATLTSSTVVDIAPAVGFALNDHLSLGLGLDFERLYGRFNLVATAFDEQENTHAHNKGSSHGVGAHAGVLYQFNPGTRAGLSYQSKVVHHVNGSSTFKGPLSNDVMGGVQFSPNFKLNFILPATTAFSVFHTLNPIWDVMGTLVYTQWNAVQNLEFENVAGILDSTSTNIMSVTVPQFFHNTWNIALGANYHYNQKWMLRMGGGFDESPVKTKYRNLALPDSNRLALAVGGHYQMTDHVGFDASWSHIFAMNTRIDHRAQRVGDQITVTNGHVKAGANVVGLQATVDFA